MDCLLSINKVLYGALPVVIRSPGVRFVLIDEHNQLVPEFTIHLISVACVLLPQQCPRRVHHGTIHIIVLHFPHHLSMLPLDLLELGGERDTDILNVGLGGVDRVTKLPQLVLDLLEQHHRIDQPVDLSHLQEVDGGLHRVDAVQVFLQQVLPFGFHLVGVRDLFHDAWRAVRVLLLVDLLFRGH